MPATAGADHGIRRVAEMEARAQWLEFGRRGEEGRVTAYRHRGYRQRAQRSRQPGAPSRSAPTNQCSSISAMRRLRKPRRRARPRTQQHARCAPASRAALRLSTRALPSNTTTAGRCIRMAAATSPGNKPAGDAGSQSVGSLVPARPRRAGNATRFPAPTRARPMPAACNAAPRRCLRCRIPGRTAGVRA